MYASNIVPEEVLRCFTLGALCIRIVVVDNCREEIGVSNMVRGIRNLNMVVYLINSRFSCGSGVFNMVMW